MDESIERATDEAIKRATDLAEWRERRAGPPGILTINGVQCQQFRRSVTWRVPTPAKLRVAQENKARRTQPSIDLDLITRNKQYYPRTNCKTVHVKCEFIPNAAAAANFQSGLNEVVENLNPATTTTDAAAASSSAEVQGRSLLKRPHEDLGESSDQTVIENLNRAADDLGTKAAEVKEGESSETNTATKDTSVAATSDV